MTGVSRIFAGILGGFAASLSKILALDVNHIAEFLFKNTGDIETYNQIIVNAYVFTPVLMALGGIIAWASQEDNRMKALAIGCAAPALMAPWTNGNLNAIDIASSAFVAPAYAESGTNQQQGTFEVYSRGISFAQTLNQIAPSINAFVGQRQPGNNLYPVIVGGTGGYLSFAEAVKLKDRALQISIVPPDAYLSNFAARLPAIQ